MTTDSSFKFIYFLLISMGESSQNTNDRIALGVVVGFHVKFSSVNITYILYSFNVH